jgi:hypothetical protein
VGVEGLEADEGIGELEIAHDKEEDDDIKKGFEASFLGKKINEGGDRPEKIVLPGYGGNEKKSHHK